MKEKSPHETAPIVVVVHSPEVPNPDNTVLRGVSRFIRTHFIIKIPDRRNELVIPLDVVHRAGISSDQEEDFDIDAAYNTLIDGAIDPYLN